MKRILITAGGFKLDAELNDRITAQKIWEALPIDVRTNRWGDEIYFTIPVSAGLEPGARQEMEVGELAYWPQGSAFCIFFGSTPVSIGDEPRAYSPVNPVGMVIGDVSKFLSVGGGEDITILRDECVS